MKDYITITLKEWLEIKPNDVNKLTFQYAGKDGPSSRAEDWLVELTIEEYEEYTKGEQI